MLRAKRQLSQDSVNNDVRPPQRLCLSMTQTNAGQQQGIEGYDAYSREHTSCTTPFLTVPHDWIDIWAKSNYNPVDPWSDVHIRGQIADAAAHTSASVSGIMQVPALQDQLSSMTQVNIDRREIHNEQTLLYHQKLSQTNEDYSLSSCNSTSLKNTINFRDAEVGVFAGPLDCPTDPHTQPFTLVQTGYNSEGSALNTSWTSQATIGLTLERHCSPVSLASNGDRKGFASHQQPQVVYNQPSSNAPIFNGNIYGSVQNSWQVAALDGLQFLYQHAAMGAIHESEERFPPPLCYPGTRDVVVGRAIAWYLNKDGRKKIMWVHAPLGYGKTAVAGTVKEKLDGMELGFDSPVGATFFFWRSSPERNSPSRFIITLACQLAQSIPDLRPHVDAVIRFKPNTVKMALEVQLMDLIVNPFKSLDNLERLPQRLIIVDGIDECIKSDRESHRVKEYAEDQEAVQIRVLNLIHCLHSHHLPLSFLILSRPEAWITRHLGSKPFCDEVEPLDLYEVGHHMNDVTRFVRAELSRIATSFGFEGVDEEWADEQALVQKSGGLMVYAATVIRHIDDEYGDPRALLRDILSSSSATTQSTPRSKPFSSLYDLYWQIMRSCPERNRSLMTSVLEDVMVSLGPVGLAFEKDARHQAGLRVLDILSGRSPGDALRALRPLHAVLRIGKANEDTRMADLVLHSSFGEFLDGPQVASEFGVDLRGGTVRLLSKILDLMASITTDTIGQKLDDSAIFALDNWCHLWWHTKETFSQSIHIDLMKKISALDLTACFVQYYLYSTFGSTMSEDVLVTLLNCSNMSDFFIQSKGLDGHPDVVSLVHTVTSLTQTSLNQAFAFVLKASTLPAFPLDMIDIMEWECVRFLMHVTSRPNWRESKVVQALGHPGPSGIQLFREVIQDICHNPSKWEWDLLEHIYDTMVQEKNPILEVEDHPFREFLELKRSTGIPKE